MVFVSSNPKTTQPPLQGRLRKAFTLVEILAVIAITSLMLLIAASVFNPSQARAGQVAKDVVIGQLNRARSHAIATGIPTAVVFSPYDQGPEASRGRTLGLVEAEVVAGNHQVSRVLERWTDLPSRQLIVGQTLVADLETTVMDSPQRLSLNLGGQNVQTPYILFSREGAVIFPQGNRVRIALGPGIVASGTPRLTGKNQDRTAVEIIEVSRLSGRIQVLNPLDQ